MAQNSIGQTLAGMQLNKTVTTTEGTAGSNSAYNPGQVKPVYQNDESSKILNGLMDFAKTGVAAYQQYDQFKTQDADRRSDEILQNMTPDQRTQALQSGQLNYQDDPYLMRSLSQKIAHNASIMADNQVMENIKNNKYSSQQEMIDDLYQSRLKAGQEAAAQNGFDFNSESFQKGWSLNASDRNLVLNEGFAQVTSNQTRTMNNLQSDVAIRNVINASNQGDAKGTAYEIVTHIQADGSAADRLQRLQKAVSQLQNTPGGDQVIKELSDIPINLGGVQYTARELIGNDGIEIASGKATDASVTFDRSERDALDSQKNAILLEPDPSKQLAMIQDFTTQWTSKHPGQVSSGFESEMSQLKQQVIQKQSQLLQHQKIAQQKQVQSDYRQDTMLQQYKNGVAGKQDAVLDMDAQNTNEQSGKYTIEDTVNAANRYYSWIMDNKDMSQDQKMSAIMHLASITPQNQGMNIVLKNKISTVSNEIVAAGLQGRLDVSKTPNLNTMIQVYRSNPGALANALAGDTNSMKLYGQVATISGFMENGIDPTIYITGQQKMATMEQIQKNDLNTNSNKFVTQTMGDTRFKGMGGLPMQISTSIFQNTYAATGDIDSATNASRKWLTDNVVDVSDSDSGTTGQLLKSSLQITQDPKSVEIGKDIVNQKVADLVNQYPVLKGKLSISTSQDGVITITDPSTTLRAVTGQAFIKISRAEMAQSYSGLIKKGQEEQAKQIKAQEERLRQNGKYNNTIIPNKSLTVQSGKSSTSSDSLGLVNANNKLGELLNRK